MKFAGNWWWGEKLDILLINFDHRRYEVFWSCFDQWPNGVWMVIVIWSGLSNTSRRPVSYNLQADASCGHSASKGLKTFQEISYCYLICFYWAGQVLDISWQGSYHVSSIWYDHICHLMFGQDQYKIHRAFDKSVEKEKVQNIWYWKQKCGY